MSTAPTYALELLREIYADLVQGAIPNADDPWWQKASAALAGTPTHAQAGAVPLDQARHLFDAGWKAAALFCDREDVVADGTIGFGACPQFEAAFSAAQPVAREQLTPERVKEIVRGAGYDQCGIPDTERAAFINGLRHGEQAHGIKGGQS